MRPVSATLCLVVCVVASGCATKRYSSLIDTGALASARAATMAGESESLELARKLTWRASLSLEVGDVGESVKRTTDIVKEASGYVEAQSDRGEKHADLKLKVPASALKDVMGRLEDLGTVEHRHVSSEDVTEQYIDTEARLKNLRALRDRLRQLLGQAKDVKDILAIEKELSRVQAEHDSLEGRLKSLKGRVANATIELALSRRPILGPLGLLLKGLWWGIEKSFVIRE